MLVLPICMEALTNRKQPTEEEIWALQDKNQQGFDFGEKQITWNPKEYYLHGIHDNYNAKSSFEWLFHFLQDKAFTHHKKTRVLRILFRYRGRGVDILGFQPKTFLVTSEPMREDLGKPAHMYRVILDIHDGIFCHCEWEGTTGIQTCTHILAVRGFFYKRGGLGTCDREQQTPNIQGEIEICAC